MRWARNRIGPWDFSQGPIPLSDMLYGLAMNQYKVFVAVTFMIASLSLGFSHSAQAADSLAPVFVASPNGVAGVSQNITVRDRSLRGKTAILSFLLQGSETVSSGVVPVNNQGFANLAWTPPTAGNFTVALTNGQSSASTTISVAAMPTATRITMPNQVQENSSVAITATVSTLGGTVAPSGTVLVRDQFDHIVATGSLGPAVSTNTATGTIYWIASIATTALKAEFVPTTTAFASSFSPYAYPSVGGDQTIALALPQDFYLNEPVMLTAFMGASAPAGSAAFSLNRFGFIMPMGGSLGTSSGSASIVWDPYATGYQSIGVNYTSNSGTVNGVAIQPIEVQAARVPAQIDLSVQKRSASVRTILATATSGSPVSLATSGPFVLSGVKLYVLSAGSCTVTASAPGNGADLTAGNTSLAIE